MRIECDFNEEEFDWWIDMYRNIKKRGLSVERVYREDGKIAIAFTPVVLSETVEIEEAE